MNTQKSLLVLCAIVLVGGSALAAEHVKHPLITPYPESTQSRSDQKEFDAYNLVTRIEDGQPAGESYEGRVTKLGFYNPRERSILEIFRNYESALVEAGMEVLFTCTDAECGPSAASNAWRRFNGITAKSGTNCRYLAGKLQTDEGATYVAVIVGRTRHEIHIVEVKEMETGLVTVDAKALARGIERDGRVSVYGIFFDTGKATLKEESRPALDEIAKLMGELPDLEIYVVGHTDNTGGFDMNMNLSRERAAAVVRELVDRYRIAEGRLSAHGVGPLVPDSTNRNEGGRSKNRRVDLVEQ